MTRYDYIDPRGRRSGPYSEAELKSLAERGLLEPDGTVALAEVGTVGKVADIPWLNQAELHAPPPPPLQPAPPRTSEEAIAIGAARAAFESAQARRSDTSRTVYVLLALLLPLVGLFGVHNIVAGYTGRGILFLVLSLVTFGGICIVVAPPCACFAVPVWIALFVVSVIEAITVTSDGKGQPFR